MRKLVLLVLVTSACRVPATPSTAPPTLTSEAMSPASTIAEPSSTTTLAVTTLPTTTPVSPPTFEITTFRVPTGSHPHDVAPAVDGGVWYTAQNRGALGRLDPSNGDVTETALGPGSAPHGVIVGPDGAPWITDSGLNAILRVDPVTLEAEVFSLPSSAPNTNLNTAAFDGDGVLWFTGQAGWYGRLNASEGLVEAFPAPRGRGPYGIAATPDGEIYYSSLAGSYLGAVDRTSGAVTEVDPPTAGAGLRRVWSDSRGRLWISQWNAGQVAVYDPPTDTWSEWALPGEDPQTYAVFVDERDAVWLTDFGANAIVRFDATTEHFTSFPSDSAGAAVRQLAGRSGEVWGAESGLDRLVVVRTVG